VDKQTDTMTLKDYFTVLLPEISKQMSKRATSLKNFLQQCSRIS